MKYDWENNDWGYDPAKAEAYPGAPLYFSRRYVVFGSILTIYGYAIRSEYTEDRHVEKSAWEARKSFLSVCFSEACPEGEMGFTPAGEISEISLEEFQTAADWGWPTL